MANARIFRDLAAAEIIEERTGAAGELAAKALAMLSDSNALHTMHASALALGKPDAAGEVASLVLGLVKNR